MRRESVRKTKGRNEYKLLNDVISRIRRIHQLFHYTKINNASDELEKFKRFRIYQKLGYYPICFNAKPEPYSHSRYIIFNICGVDIPSLECNDTTAYSIQHRHSCTGQNGMKMCYQHGSLFIIMVAYSVSSILSERGNQWM